MPEIVLLNNIVFKGVKNLPVFKIEYTPSNIDLSSYDALVFTSKNAIYAIDSFNKSWINIPSYCIAQKTGKIVEECGGRVEFIGKASHGKGFAQELISELKNKKTLYIRAHKTVSNLTEILNENQIDIDELLAYKTVCNTEVLSAPKNNSVIIFTSPSSVECFFKRFSWHESFQAIVIGNTTAKYMPKNIHYHISPIQSIDSCIKLASTLY